MADLSITATSVLAGSDAVTVSGTAGATVTAGQAVYKDTSDSNKWKLAQADGTAAEAGSGGLGIALHGAASGQPLVVITGGSIDGVAATEGIVYVVSQTAGGIAPITDLTNIAPDYVSLLGVGDSGAGIKLAILASGESKQ